MAKAFKYIIYFLLFFALFYSETMQVGSMTFSQVWKMPLVVYLFYCYASSNKKYPSFIPVALGFALMQILNSDIITNSFFAFSRLAKFADFPLLFAFFYTKKYSSEKLWKITISVAQYFILTTIPYILNILPEKQTIEHVYGDTVGRLYIFQSMHAASIILSFAIIVIAYNLKYYCKTTVGKVYNAILLLIGFYAIFGTFVRTGWLMSLLGILIIFFPRKFSAKELMISIAILAGVAFFVVYQYNNNADFVNRLFDNGDARSVDKDALGSGRMIFLATGLELFFNSNVIEMLLGCGALQVFDYMDLRLGMHIGLHNGFGDALVMNGIIGFSLLIMMLFRMFLFIKKYKQSRFYLLLIAFYIPFVACMYTQGNIGFGQDLFAALLLSLLYYDYTEMNIRKLSHV